MRPPHRRLAAAASPTRRPPRKPSVIVARALWPPAAPVGPAIYEIPAGDSRRRVVPERRATLRRHVRRRPVGQVSGGRLVRSLSRRHARAKSCRLVGAPITRGSPTRCTPAGRSRVR
eukprot:scaffold78314_cov45-Phaeocystis_antarctica.AAC.1